MTLNESTVILVKGILIGIFIAVTIIGGVAFLGYRNRINTQREIEGNSFLNSSRMLRNKMSMRSTVTKGETGDPHPPTLEGFPSPSTLHFQNLEPSRVRKNPPRVF